MRVFSWLKTQDTLGTKVGFTVNGNDSHQTVLGGLGSLFLTGLYLTFFYNFSLNMIEKTSPLGYTQIKPMNMKNIKANINLAFNLLSRLLIWCSPLLRNFEESS